MKTIIKQRIKEDSKKPTRYFSSKQEQTVANSLNGQQQLNSGATAFIKGDVSLDNWLLECKTKTKNSESMSIKKEWLEKNSKEALFMGKDYSAVVFNFGPGQSNYYIIDELTFKELWENFKK